MKKVLLSVLGIAVLCVLGIALWFFLVLSNLPDVSVLKHYRPAAAAAVLDKDGSVLTHYYDRTFRIWVPIASLPDIVIQAVVIAEDDLFFEHTGVNYRATWDALVHDVQKHRFARGGSTITQQMIKNVLLSKEKTLTRKIREYVLARKAEELLTKRQILQIYLNEVEWGDDLYGIEAASRFYLGKHAAELNPSEAALLAGMLPNPRYYNPFKRMNKARERQERVLFNMQQAKLITPEVYAASLQTPVQLRQNSAVDGPDVRFEGSGRPCYQRALEQVLLSVLDDQTIYRSGKAIRTTLDSALQKELGQGAGLVTDKKDETGEMLLVVKEGDLVRALVCSSGREQEIRGMLETRSTLQSGYVVNAVAPQSITRDQIIMSLDNEAT